ncbi:MAG: DUF1385 domain-containing protein [Candidatus Cloacimonadia bacterium]
MSEGSSKQKEDPSPKLSIGGQAVIEGVMMRGPEYIATAVRRKNNQIVIKREKFTSITRKKGFFNLPIVRGFISLIEMLIIGFKGLNFSAKQAMEDEEAEQPPKKKESKAKDTFYEVVTYLFAIGLAFFFFFYLPYQIAYWINISETSVLFNLFVGIIRVIFFVVYIYLISLQKDIHRIFEYHGAEHKSVFAYEDDPHFTLSDTKRYGTHHPRCGTSFIFLVLIIAIVIFSIFDAVVAWIVGHPLSLWLRIALHLLLTPFVAGISYEALKLTGKNINHWFVKWLALPGLALQKITTKQPDESQLEVAVCALRAALNMPVDCESIEFIDNNGNKK